MSVTACILSFNSHATIEEVLSGVAQQTRQADRVVVVDNGSDAATLAVLERHADSYELVKLSHNLGVGAGHNVGWQLALEDPGCEFVWSLENDSIPPADCLEKLLEAAKELSRAGTVFGCVLPKQVLPDESHVATNPTLHVDTRLTFNGILLPTDVIRSIGFIREDFFVDQEDREYAHRLRSAGYPIYVEPDAKIVHLGKGKTRRGIVPSIGRTYYRVRNEIYLQKEVLSRPWSAVRAVVRCVGGVARTVVVEDMKSRRALARVFATWDGIRGDLGEKDYRFLNP